MHRCSNFADDDVLPHVARYLNTEYDASYAENNYSTAYLWSMRQDALDSINWGLGAKAEWMIEFNKGKTIPFQWHSVELAIFRLGVGALTIEAIPQAQDMISWLDFIPYFRFFSGGSDDDSIESNMILVSNRCPFGVRKWGIIG